MPTQGIDEIYQFTPNKDDLINVEEAFNNDLEIRPEFFIKTDSRSNHGQKLEYNPQTFEICDKLDICYGNFGMPDRRFEEVI